MARSGTYHQDYIARIRYSNVLPPPPNPPKLLDIPGTGLSGGQYTSAGYASRLAREQELNIEADGELGMPIDLVGIPGVFDGDESAIQGLENPPPPHPLDKPLLRPLSMLGKPAHMTSGVSFLRRTEYISSEGGRHKTETPLRSKPTTKKRKASEVERDDDPVRMLRGIYKGFDTAYPQDAYHGPDTSDKLRGDPVTAEASAAWERPTHPSNPDLTPLDTYPILPDLDAFPDSGNFFVIKYQTNPGSTTDSYDTRLDAALLHPQEPHPNAMAEHTAQQQAYASDPTLPPPKPVEFNYDFYLPENAKTTASMQLAMDPHNPGCDDPELYESSNAETARRFFRFHLQRQYETYNQSDSHADPWGESLAVALHDPTDENPRGLQKAAYVYPVVQRAIIRPRRKMGLGAVPGRDEEDKIDFLDVSVRAPVEAEAEKREGHKRALMEVGGLANSGGGEVEVNGHGHGNGRLDEVNGDGDAAGDVDGA